MLLLIFSFALVGVLDAQPQPMVNVTWSQLDGIQQLPNGDVILGRVAEQTGTFCVQNLEVGVRVLLDDGVEWWKAVELDADDPEGSNRFIVQHTGQADAVTGIFPSRFISSNLLVLWKGEPGGTILPPYRDQLFPAYMITDFKDVFEGGQIYDILWVQEGESNW